MHTIDIITKSTAIFHSVFYVPSSTCTSPIFLHSDFDDVGFLNSVSVGKHLVTTGEMIQLKLQKSGV